MPERQVVLEERRMRTDNVPAALLDEAVREQLFGRHKPYGMPISGYADDIKKLSVNELTAFYRRYYAPNNAVLIVAGDTTPEAVRKLAEKHYGPIPSRKVEPRAAAGARAAPACRSASIRADARVVEPRWSRDCLAPSYRGRRDAACLCAAGAGPPVRRQRDQPAVARAGGRRQARPVGVGRLQPDEPRPHLFDIAVHPAPRRAASRRSRRRSATR